MSLRPTDAESELQGTTGNPKGVVLTQGALAAATYSNLSGWDLPADAIPITISYLPLAHIYGVSQALPFSASGFELTSSSYSERSSSMSLPKVVRLGIPLVLHCV